jgi:hypothetical protein
MAVLRSILIVPETFLNLCYHQIVMQVIVVFHYKES